MKLGVHIGYWGLGLTREDQLEIVQEAERLGYDSVWTAEAYGSDAATILGWIAGLTEKIKIGSAIFQIPGRSPAMTAMTAATLDQLSDGRMLLGIGSSGPQVSEGWHGVRFAHQLAGARDATRPFVALYVGGMGSRKQNFYNALMRRYGFEDAAEKVQDLYLEGKKEEAAAALPDEFLDQVALIGPRDVVRDRLRVYREAGVGTLGLTPLAFDKAGRLEQLRIVAELAEEAA